MGASPDPKQAWDTEQKIRVYLQSYLPHYLPLSQRLMFMPRNREHQHISCTCNRACEHVCSHTEEGCEYLGLAHKYAMPFITSEVLPALDSSIILALCFIQDHAYPFASGKECGSNIGHRASVPFSNHLHTGAHSQRPGTGLCTHSVAAGCLKDTCKHTQLKPSKVFS